MVKVPNLFGIVSSSFVSYNIIFLHDERLQVIDWVPVVQALGETPKKQKSGPRPSGKFRHELWLRTKWHGNNISHYAGTNWDTEHNSSVWRKANGQMLAVASLHVLQHTYSIMAILKKSHAHDCALFLLVCGTCVHVGVLALLRETLGCSYHKKKWTENLHSVIKRIFLAFKMLALTLSTVHSNPTHKKVQAENRAGHLPARF